MLNNFEAATRILNCTVGQAMKAYQSNNQDLRKASYRERLNLFFIDHEFVPLIVQENYLSSMGDRNSLADLKRLAEAADMISQSDMISISIRKDQNWALLPDFGSLSSIAPCLLI